MNKGKNKNDNNEEYFSQIPPSTLFNLTEFGEKKVKVRFNLEETPNASQPTICRLENLPGKRELYNMAKAFIVHFIDSYESRPGIIILDCDDTNSYTYICIRPCYYENHTTQIVKSVCQGENLKNQSTH